MDRPSDSVVHGIQAGRLIRTAPTKSPNRGHFYESKVTQGDAVPLRRCRATASVGAVPEGGPLRAEGIPKRRSHFESVAAGRRI